MTPRDIATLRAAGFHAFLVGEHLMKSGDPAAPCESWLPHDSSRFAASPNAEDAAAPSTRAQTPSASISIRAVRATSRRNRRREIPTTWGVRRVGIFVNESRDRIAEIARIAALDIAQLHGEKPSPVIPRTSPSGKRAGHRRFELRARRRSECRGHAARWPRRRTLWRPGQPSIGPSRAPPASASSSPEASMRQTSPKRSPSLAPGESMRARASKPRPGKRTTPKCKHSFKPRIGRPFSTTVMTPQPDTGGHFGPYGGRFVPEVLMAPVEELEQAYLEARADPTFKPSWPICCATTPDARRRFITPSGSAKHGRRAHLAEARRPAAHRRAQDQQLHSARRCWHAHG